MGHACLPPALHHSMLMGLLDFVTGSSSWTMAGELFLQLRANMNNLTGRTLKRLCSTSCITGVCYLSMLFNSLGRAFALPGSLPPCRVERNCNTVLSSAASLPACGGWLLMTRGVVLTVSPGRRYLGS